jgi:hypothetical protein
MFVAAVQGLYATVCTIHALFPVGCHLNDRCRQNLDCIQGAQGESCLSAPGPVQAITAMSAPFRFGC